MSCVYMFGEKCVLKEYRDESGVKSNDWMVWEWNDYEFMWKNSGELIEEDGIFYVDGILRSNVCIKHFMKCLGRMSKIRRIK